MAFGKKGSLQSSQALLVRQAEVAGEVGGPPDQRTAFRRIAGGTCGDNDTTHLFGIAGGGHAGDEMAIGMTGNDSASIAQGIDDIGDILREIIKVHALHRTDRLAYSPRLRPQDLEAIGSQCLREHVIVAITVPSLRRQKHDSRPLAFDKHFDGDILVADNFRLGRPACFSQNDAWHGGQQHGRQGHG
nr:hypothetical protein [Mesorhizobium amorphae]